MQLTYIQMLPCYHICPLMAKNGGVKGRDGSVEELDRETDEEQITVGWTRRKDGR